MTYNCKANGTYTDFMKLIKTCEAEVFDLQKVASATPQLTMLAGAMVQDNVAYDANGFKLDAMSETCGMALGASNRARGVRRRRQSSRRQTSQVVPTVPPP